MRTYDSSTVLLVVDMQNDFADPKGSLYVRGGEQVLPLANAEISRALESGVSVVYTQDWHPPSTPHFQKDGGIWPVHCVQGTWGAELHPDLEVKGEVVRKGEDGRDGYSGFSARDTVSGDVAATRLGSVLRAAGAERLVVMGLATDYCVVETVLDARRQSYPVEVVREGIRAVDLQPGEGDRALERMREAGAELD